MSKSRIKMIQVYIRKKLSFHLKSYGFNRFRHYFTIISHQQRQIRYSIKYFNIRRISKAFQQLSRRHNDYHQYSVANRLKADFLYLSNKSKHAFTRLTERVWFSRKVHENDTLASLFRKLWKYASAMERFRVFVIKRRGIRLKKAASIGHSSVVRAIGTDDQAVPSSITRPPKSSESSLNIRANLLRREIENIAYAGTSSAGAESNSSNVTQPQAKILPIHQQQKEMKTRKVISNDTMLLQQQEQQLKLPIEQQEVSLAYAKPRAMFHGQLNM